MKGKFGVIGILSSLALLVALMVGSGVASASNQGSVEILAAVGDSDAASWTTNTSTIYIQLSDSDLDTATAVDEEEIDYTSPGACDTDGELMQFQLDNVPILDADSDDVVNFNDVTVGSTGNADTSVFSVDAVNGIVTLKCDTAAGAATSQFVDYSAPGANTAGADEAAASASIVTVTSTADEVGIGVQLTEIDADDGSAASATGIFGSQVTLCITSACSDGTATPPTLEVAPGTNDTVTFSYADAGDDDSTVTTSVTVETTEPAYTGFSPADAHATTVGRPTVSASITDSDSGVDEDSVNVVFRLTETDGTTVLDGPETKDADATGTLSEITSGYSASHRLPATLTTAEEVYLIQWWVIGDDTAGNISVSDSDDDTACVAATFDVDTGGSTLGNCDPYTIRVDFVSPGLSSAVAGNWWDSSEDEGSELQSGADGAGTAIQVVFDENVDGTSVHATDFDSDDVTITAADWYADDADAVYLTVSGMDADDTPEISIVGSISDEAGNATTTGDVDATDGVPATLTVTVTALTDETVTVGITSDETLNGSPTVSVRRVEDDGTAGATNEGGTATATGTKTWELEADISDQGLYNVVVSGTDVGGAIAVTVGDSDGSAAAAVDITATGAILFEVDNAIPAPTFSPADAADVDRADPFVSIDFADEGKEYGLEADGDHTTTPANVDTDYDGQGDITIVSAELDDAAITLVTRDNSVFSYAAEGLALGDHDLEISVTDAAGNEADFSITFTVVERSEVSVALTRGMNLISFRENPVSPGINDVFGADSGVDLVLTYDASDWNPWQVAQRDPSTGEFGWDSEIETVEIGRAYWVNSDGFNDVEYLSSPWEPAAGAIPGTPPAIAVTGGAWNLVGFVSMSGETEIDADDYLSGSNWSIAYTYDPATGWSAIRPTGADTIDADKGYYVFSTEDGTITP